MTNLQKKTLVAIVILGIATLGIVYTKHYIDNIKRSLVQHYESEIRDLERTDNVKLEDLKDDILNRLKSCESGKLTLDDAPIILDTNHKMSIGLYMFQRDTVIHYYKKLYGTELTKKQATEIALSEKARDLARDIIFKERGGIFNWKNCSRKEGLAPEITIIKKLME